jgi:hypothetical protein
MSPGRPTRMRGTVALERAVVGILLAETPSDVA